MISRLPIRQRLEATFAVAVERAFPELRGLRFEVYKPRDKAFGDFATNAAMIAAKRLKTNPFEIAEKIAAAVEVPSPLIASIDVAKPGFINIVVSRPAYLEKLKEIATCPHDDDYGRGLIGRMEKVQVEFVSANPTGPLNVVSARAAAVGDALVRILRRIGCEAKSEFYVNDGGTQVELLGESLKARFREALGEKVALPEGGYPGGYLVSIADKVGILAHGADKRVAEERAAGVSPALKDELGHIDGFLEKTITARVDERETIRGHFEEYFAFRQSLDPKRIDLWVPLYICHLSSLGLTRTEILFRLQWIELFRDNLRSDGGAQAATGGEPVHVSAPLFLGETVKGVGFDFARFAVSEIVEMQKESLASFGCRPDGGVEFDTWVHESSFKDEVGNVLEALVSDGRFVVEKEGAVWLKGGEEGEEDEWVIRRSTGQPTYFLSDIAYHVDKRKRGFDRVIDIWGPDHHGHVGRMQTAMQIASEVIPGLEIPDGWLEVLIAQQVNLVKQGKRVQMSKRAGEYVTLDDVLKEIAPDPNHPRTGADVARFFFLMRRCNSHLDFDLDLAKKMSDENPVYYVQYAHARISSIIEFARQNGFEEMPPAGADLSLLASDEATELMRAVADFDDLVIGSAQALEPHRIPVYLIDLAGKFHRFYHNHRVVTDDRALSEARLYLCYAVRTILRSALSLIGISAPTSM